MDTAAMNDFANYLYIEEGGKLGLVHIAGDQGGATHAGVTYTTWRTLAHKFGWDDSLEGLRKMDAAQYATIVNWFMDSVHGKEIHDLGIAFCITDIIWGAGNEKLLQNTLNDYFGDHLVVDGIVGKATLDATNQIIDSGKAADLLKDLKARYILYVDRIGTGPTDPNPGGKFTKGWLNRNEARFEFCSKYIGITNE